LENRQRQKDQRRSPQQRGPSHIEHNLPEGTAGQEAELKERQINGQLFQQIFEESQPRQNGQMGLGKIDGDQIR
jgi:hypothetical protein